MYRLLGSAAEGCPGHGPAYLLVESAAEIGFQWDSRLLGWERLGLPVLSNLVLPIVYRIWASARMGQLDGWFKSWVPDSVFSAGGGRGSVEAWYTTALDIEEVLSGAVDSHVHLFVADVVKFF